MPPKPTTKKASTGAAKPAKKETKVVSKPATKKATGAAKPAKKDTKASGKTSKAVAKGKSATKTTKAIQKKKSVWEKNPRNFGIGNDIQPKRDLTRFTKWPRYVVLQRKKRILQLRLTVPPALNQFTNTLDTNAAANLFKLLNKYRPEDKIAKRNRLLKVAKGELKPSTTKPLVVKCGINHVTKLVEDKKAALVIIAHDVDPIELVVFLPALCRKQGVPYCIVKGKARLGQVVHKKTATVLALTGVANEHRAELAQLVTIAQSQFNDKYEEHKKRWGASVLGLKSQAKLRKQAREAAKEAKDKLKYQ